MALPISRLIKTMLILMLMGHIDACLFWFIDQTLHASERWIDVNHLLYDHLGNAVGYRTQYLVSYLTALRSLVLKLREVLDDTENVYVIFEFIVGILAYGTVFGNIHSIVEMLDNTAALNQAEDVHKFRMDWLKTYMRDKKLRPELQQMVATYKEIQWQRSKGMDEDLLFSDIPRSVQQEIKNFLYLELIKKVPVFKDTDSSFQNHLAFKIKSLVVLDGWFIFRKGDDGEEMYFIKSGKVDIIDERGTIFVTLSTGQFFGEIALFESCKRTATARANGTVELCTLLKEEFSVIMDTYPVIADRIRQTIQKRKEQEEKVKNLHAAVALERARNEAERAKEEAEAALIAAAEKKAKEEEAKRRAEMWGRLSKSKTFHHAGSGSHSKSKSERSILAFGGVGSKSSKLDEEQSSSSSSDIEKGQE
ncbi:hypothetical protein HDU76_013438 [Blyttiomyces sp. JEL0837]|nr:hypothetical protein HDU76_013438 [Blyttiomyces sp. JEL0837]